MNSDRKPGEGFRPYESESDVKKMVLDAFFDETTDSGRFTSQDICDNLRETVALSPTEVTAYMMKRGYTLQRQDDRMVWVVL